MTESGEPERRRRPYRRRAATAIAAVCCAALVGATAALALAGRGAAPGGPAVAVAVGDIVKVNGAPIGCAVRFQSGVRALDCRRIGTLTGTYGTILTGGQVLVVRYLTPHKARIVFSAHHGDALAHRCG